ncbi:MAG: hypothetical protein GXY61_00460 [Lentisphaerae bacterium]|nr:hypothetical protein [Lentisphaerota bacterium]
MAAVREQGSRDVYGTGKSSAAATSVAFPGMGRRGMSQRVAQGVLEKGSGCNWSKWPPTPKQQD